MKRLFDPLFTAYCLLWGLVHLCRYIHHPLPVLNGYLTDFLAVPAIAHVTLTVIRYYLLRDPQYTYPFYYLLFIALYLSIVFEWAVPRYSPVYTGDIMDVAAYFAGSLFYYFFHCRPVIRTAGRRS